MENRADLISTVWKTPYPAMPTWTNTLPRHFCRGPASHKPFDFLPSIYPFYMFLGRRSLGEGGYTAKTFSVHRRVHNHFTKRILNLILNRKKFFRRENDPLDKQKPRQNRTPHSARLWRLTSFGETGVLQRFRGACPRKPRKTGVYRIIADCSCSGLSHQNLEDSRSSSW